MAKEGQGKIAQKAAEMGMTEREYLTMVLTEKQSIAGAADVIEVYPRAVRDRMRHHRIRLDVEVKVVHY